MKREVICAIAPIVFIMVSSPAMAQNYDSNAAFLDGLNASMQSLDRNLKAIDASSKYHKECDEAWIKYFSSACKKADQIDKSIADEKRKNDALINMYGAMAASQNIMNGVTETQ